MPHDKKAAHKHLVEWRVFARNNLGAAAANKTICDDDLKFVVTFRDKTYAKTWVEKNGDTKKVYIVQQWIDRKHVDTQHAWQCPICDFGQKARCTFAVKWCWDAARKWHASNYVHKSEVPNVKCIFSR